MLAHLSVKNYALIEALEVDFSNGFTVITGETGSGKSIILGALGLLLGNRADLKALKDSSVKCVIEGTFNLSETVYKSFFDKNDIDFESQTIVRREITPSGKSRAFINDTPVILPILKELGVSLIDIHSQHQTLLLNKPDFQFNVLDVASNSTNLKSEYATVFYEYKTITKKLNLLIENEQKAISDKDYISFQLKEFEGINLSSLADENIEEELSLLTNAEEIINISNEITTSLNGSNSAIDLLMNAEQLLQKLSGINDAYSDLYDRIKSSIIELTDIEEEISKKTSSIEINEGRLIELTELFDTINRLQRKHNVNSVEELILVKEDFEKRIFAVSSLSEEISAFKIKQAKKYEDLIIKGEQLSKNRKENLSILQNDVKKHLAEMGMPHAELLVELNRVDKPTEFGIESIDFKVKTNKGSEFESLKNVASGGELSRIMLAIKSILCVNGNLPSIIFDEIDTGVSGEVAGNMGVIMAEMSNHLQVISITHLPQIASKGKQHLKVFKEVRDTDTLSKISTLTNDERLVEIAQMLSGENPSKAAIENARELLN